MSVGSFILASGSPRRRDLLTEAGIAFTVEVSSVDESVRAGESSADMVKRLSRLKAQAVWSQHVDCTVLGADTVVVLDGEALGKPADLDDARRMLRRLSGRTHEVLTGVSIVYSDGTVDSWVAVTGVKFHVLSDMVIEEYLRLVDVLDKAGSYGIQCHGELLVEGIDGLWSNVVGLPVEDVVEHLRKHKTARQFVAREL